MKCSITSRIKTQHIDFIWRITDIKTKSDTNPKKSRVKKNIDETFCQHTRKEGIFFKKGSRTGSGSGFLSQVQSRNSAGSPTAG